MRILTKSWITTSIWQPAVSGWKEPFREVSVNIPVRMADANSQIPIIFVTAHGDASLCDLVMRAGASGFLNKPVRSDALLKEIQAALENAAKGRQRG